MEGDCEYKRRLLVQPNRIDSIVTIRCIIATKADGTNDNPMQYCCANPAPELLHVEMLVAHIVVFFGRDWAEVIEDSSMFSHDRKNRL